MSDEMRNELLAEIAADKEAKRRRHLRYKNEDYEPGSKHEYTTTNRERIVEYNRKRFNDRKDKAIAFLGGKCSKCEGVFHRAAFDFHHIDPNQKDHTIASLISGREDVMYRELSKCELICANCHRILHAEIHDELREVDRTPEV
jgi:hypothetical protein